MTDDRHDTTEEAVDRAFGARIAAHFAPPETTPAERVAFNQSLDRRLARRGRQRAQLAAGVAVAALAWLTFLWLPASTPHAPTSAPATVAATPDSARSVPAPSVGDDPAVADSEAWDYEVWYAGDLLEADDADAADDGLPADYAAIAGAFLDV